MNHLYVPIWPVMIYRHIFDVINVHFPEVIEGPAPAVIVSDDEISVIIDADDTDYNVALLEEHLISFVTEQAG